MLPAAVKSIREIGPALKYLTAMKKTVELTPFEVQVWVATLSAFDVSIINETVIRIGLSKDPFPDCGKIFQDCDRIRREREGTQTTDGSFKIGSAMLMQVADSLQLKVGA